MVEGDYFGDYLWLVTYRPTDDGCWPDAKRGNGGHLPKGRCPWDFTDETAAASHAAVASRSCRTTLDIAPLLSAMTLDQKATARCGKNKVSTDIDVLPEVWLSQDEYGRCMDLSVVNRAVCPSHQRGKSDGNRQ